MPTSTRAKSRRSSRRRGSGSKPTSRNEKINYKVREHSVAKVPHLLVVGKREAEEGTVALRTLGEERQQFIALDEAIALLKAGATAPSLRAS